MAERAQVQSIEAIEAFRSRLIVYLSKARPVVEEVGTELNRIQRWIETERLRECERELRQRARAAEEAEAALFSARLSTFRDTMASEQLALHRAREALARAEEKQRAIRRWMREFGPRTESLARQVGSLDSVLAQDMAQAVAWLSQAIRALAAYADVHPVGNRPPEAGIVPPGTVGASQGEAP